jgi:hypothetical protein
MCINLKQEQEQWVIEPHIAMLACAQTLFPHISLPSLHFEITERIKLQITTERVFLHEMNKL